MAVFETWLDQDLKKPVRIQYLSGNLFSQDNMGNLIGVNVTDDGAPATLGGSVSANVIRADGATVAVDTGVLSGNKASVTLPQAAYAVPGVITVVIKITSGTDVTTLAAVVTTVYRSSTDTIVDPGTIIPSIQTLISQIETAVASIPSDYSSLWTTLAPAYSTSATYAVGQYVTYNGGLYRCTTAITSAESWTAAHWTAAKVGNDLSDLKSVLNEFVHGENIAHPLFSIAAVIQTSTGKLIDYTGALTYCFELKQNKNYIAEFIAGNVHRISLANSPYSADLVTNIIYTKSDGSALANENIVFNTGANKYAYIQVQSGVSTPGQLILHDQNVYEKVEDKKKQQIDTVMKANSGTGKIANVSFEQGTFNSSNNSIDDPSRIRSEYFNGGAYIFNPEKLSFAVGIYNTSYTFLRYLVANESATSPSGYYKDSYLYLPRLYSGYYRITVSGYNDAHGARGIFFPNDNTITICSDTDEKFLVGSISTSGYSSAYDNLLSKPITIAKNEVLQIALTNTLFKYAVYAIDENNSISLKTDGFIQKPIEFYDESVSYVIRIVGVSTTYVKDGSAQWNAVSIRTGPRIGYERNYTDVTYSLTSSNNTIENNAVVQSNNCLMIELPNSGNVEIKENNPMVEFCVYSYDGTNYTLVCDWTYYTYRYFADANLTYYALVRYYPNHTVITKFKKFIKVSVYYDSTDYKAINSKLYNKTIAVMGDSIVQGRFRNMGDSVNDVLVKPWSELIGETTQKASDNYGLGGACVYETDWKSLYSNKSKITGYDVVFVCAGTNDCSSSVSEANFKSAYQSVIDTLSANNAKIVLITPTSRTTENANSLSLKLSDYAGFVKDLAETNSLDLIDLYDYTKYHAQFKASLIDGLHPDALGHRIIADFVVNEYI